jgi:hypothetical protein
VAELFGSDVTLIGAALAGLALTSLGIIHDLGRFSLDQAPAAIVVIHVETP